VAAPLLVWISQSLTTKLGVSVGVEFASQLASFIQGEDENLIVYEQQLKEQAISALTAAENEILDALYYRELDPTIKRRIFLLSKRQLPALSNKISFSGTSDGLSEENKNNISYLNVMLLSYTQSILSKIKNINDALEDNTQNELDYSEITHIIREVEQILEIKSLLLNIDNKNILKYLSDNNPELFVKIRSLAGIISRMEETKKSRITPHKYHEKIQGYLLYILDDIINDRGPIVSFRELYSDFIKAYPNVEINQPDLEKAVQELCVKGMIDNFTEVDEGFKIIKIKPLKFSDSYQNVIIFISNNQPFLENGISKEELAATMNYTITLSEQLLDELASDDIAWKHGLKYYFPGLAESAYKLKTTVVEINDVR